MHDYFPSTRFQSALALAVAIVTGVWWLSVPAMIATSTFIALCVVLAASVWVVVTTSENARPASSLAQALHDDAAAAVNRRRRRDA